MYKKILSLSVLALSFNLAQSTEAFAHKGHCYDKHGYRHQIEKLDLTNDQKVKIKEIIIKTDEVIMRDHAELKALHKETNEEFIANTMTDAKIDQIVDKKLPIIGDMMKARLKERLAISQVLTDAQKEKIAQMIAKHAEEDKHDD